MVGLTIYFRKKRTFIYQSMLDIIINLCDFKNFFIIGTVVLSLIKILYIIICILN